MKSLKRITTLEIMNAPNTLEIEKRIKSLSRSFFLNEVGATITSTLTAVAAFGMYQNMIQGNEQDFWAMAKLGAHFFVARQLIGTRMREIDTEVEQIELDRRAEASHAMAL